MKNLIQRIKDFFNDILVIFIILLKEKPIMLLIPLVPIIIIIIAIIRAHKDKKEAVKEAKKEIKQHT